MKSEKFLRLVRENQDLPIIPMVDSAVVADNDYGSWLGSFGDCRIDSYVSLKYYGEERQGERNRGPAESRLVSEQRNREVANR